MTIKNVSRYLDVTGQINSKPGILKVFCDNTYAQVIAAGFLTPSLIAPYDVSEDDLVLVKYDDSIDWFSVSIDTAGVITLEPTASGVTLPVVSGDFAVFDGTTGRIKDAGYAPSNAAKTTVPMMNAAVAVGRIAYYTDTAGTLDDNAAVAINGGDLQAGLSGTKGILRAYPATAARGYLELEAAENAGDTRVTLKNASHGQTTTYTIPDVGAAAANIPPVKTTPTPGVGAVATFATTDGVLQYNTGALRCQNSANAGASATIVVTDSNITPAHKVWAWFSAQTSPAVIRTSTAGSGNFTIVCDTKPDACTIEYLALLAQ